MSAKPRDWDETLPQNMFSQIDVVDDIGLLERRLSKIEEFLATQFPEKFKLFSNQTLGGNEESTAKPRRGPKTVTNEQLGINQRMWIWFLEQHWPELQPVLKKQPDVDSFLRAVEVLAPIMDGPWANYPQRLTEAAESICAFIKTRDYAGDPRRLAVALAGIPQISWTTSLKRLRKYSSHQAIGYRALHDYFRRKFRISFLKLLRATNEEQARNIAGQVYTDDREFVHLQKYPDWWFETKKAAEPNPLLEHLGISVE